MSGEKNRVLETFNRFIDMMEIQNFETVNEMFTDDAEFRSSALGQINGRDNIRDLLAGRKLSVETLNVRVFNNVIGIEDSKAYQSVYLIMMMSVMIDGFMHIFNCGFITSIEYRKADENWLIASLISNMTFESGNSLLVGGKWKLIDYSRINGNDLDLITGNKGAWAVKHSGLDDKEAIRDVFCHYCWLIDTFAFEKLGEVYTDPYFMINEKVKGYDEGMAVSVAQAAELFRAQRYRTLEYEGKVIPREACWNHLIHVKEVNIQDDEADAIIYRYEPNRIGTRFIHRYNHKVIYYSGVWKIHFVKENNVWKINRFAFTSEINEDANDDSKRVY